MSLTTGARLGPYEILGPLGAGGMGEVYRARDTRLERDVAIKVLPAHFSNDAKFRERFEREARSISSLNHPNICILYDVGRQDSVDYLVLEYMEGESLAQKLDRGALPIEQVIAYGIQIADALERAHRQGVIHRDLKPANVMVTKNGVKLLDFGLAKPMAGASVAAAALGSMTVSQQPKPLTAEGTLVGTFQYMAPEQLDGRDADPRSDLFALGCVLYEMATGKRPFDGKTQASVVAAILATEPRPISELVPLTPPAFERLVRTCLAKDPDDRWQTAHDVKLQLKWIAEGGSAAGVAAPVAAYRKHREWAAWIVAAVLGMVAVSALGAYWMAASKPQPVVRSSILLPEKVQFKLMGRNGAPAISPDGTKIAFSAIYNNQLSIWVRELSQKDPKPLPGTDEGYAPFWSPDGRYLAFFANGKLKKINVAGGAPETICDADDGRGGSWGSKDVILFANRFSPLYMVPASGGKPTPATELNNVLSHRWPHFLPDGEHFLFVSTPTGAFSVDSNVQMGSIRDKSTKRVLDAGYTFDFVNGKIFYLRDSVLNVQSFDASKGEVMGEATLIAGDVQVDSLFSDALFSVSGTGMLVYAPGSLSNLAELAWFDHHGKSLGKLGEPGLYIEVHISPDETKVAAIESKQGANIDIWIHELGRGVHSRLTTTGTNRYPVWAPDGSAIIYGFSQGSSQLNLYRKQVTGDSPPELLASDPAGLIPTDWSRDGKYLAITSRTADTKSDISILSLADKKMAPFLKTPFNESSARFSPDGHWLAFASDESGHYEVYLSPFPGGGRKWQVSTAGGTQPLWSKSGSELYYFAPDNTLTSVSFAGTGTEPKFGIPVALFKAHPRNYEAIYDVTKDGRFLISSAPDESTAPLMLINNWPSLVKK